MAISKTKRWSGALTTALVTGALLIPASAHAASGDDLDIGFAGSLVGTTAYTSVEGENIRGVVHRIDGAEEQIDGGGVQLAGGEQGIRYEASDFSLSGDDATTGFLAEISYTPAAQQDELATIFAAGGNLFVRSQNGRLTYGFDSLVDGSWKQSRGTAALPTADTTHALSLQYFTDDDGTELHVSVDGVELPVVTSTAPATVNQKATSSFGFGNDVHPAGGDRGLNGDLLRVRVLSGIAAYDSSAYLLQPEPVSTSLLNIGFNGSIDDGRYTPGSDETLTGTAVPRGGAAVADGLLNLTAAGDALDFEADEVLFDEGSVDSPFVAEVEFTAQAAQKDLATLIGVAGNISVRYRAGSLQYGFSSNSSGTWTDHMQNAPLPASGESHIVSMAYIPTDDGAEMVLWLDGQEQQRVSAAERATRNGAVTVTAAFGNDVPQVGSRGFIGSIDRARFAVLHQEFSDGAFEFQERSEPVVCEDLGDLEPASYFEISAADCPANLLTKASMLRPTDQQLDWQELRLTGFVHYGLNTYYNQEWGHGTEDPARFDPTGEVDVDTWMKTLRDSGHRMAILTVKHHDGFLLYPSRYTDYDVASSPWKDGEGDIVREFTDAAERYGMKVGLYLSPADSHEEIAGSFGNGSPKSTRTIPTLVDGDDRAGEDVPTFEYEATDYGAYFLNTLYEVLTQYGEIDEVWFDGANGNTEKQEIFDYPAFYDLIDQLQPNAVVAVGGRDVRWVGNERGVARQDEWAPVAITDKGDGGKIGLVSSDFESVGSADQLATAAAGGADALHWWPTEADMKLTGGWFAHPNDTPKSGTELLNHYLGTVGRNSVMLLNTPPTVNGSFADASAQSLQDFAEQRRLAFTDDLALGVSAETDTGASALLTDGNARTAWESGSADSTSVTFDLGSAQTVSHVELGEGVAIAGQTVEAFSVQAEIDGAWTTVASAGTIGVNRIVSFDEPVAAQRFRVTIDQARAPYALANVSLYATLDEDPGRLTEIWLDCSAEVAGPGTKDRPFSSLDQFRDAELAPGAAVHLRSGADCADSTTPFWGYGTDDEPITVDVYGGDVAPVFGTRTAAEVFGGLEVQGWTLNLPEPVDPSAPVLQLDSDTLVVGKSATVGLAGFEPDASVTVELHSDPQVFGTVTVDAAGAGSLTATVPAVEAGAHTLVALVDDEVVAEREVQVIAGGSGSDGSDGSTEDSDGAAVGAGTDGLATTGAAVPIALVVLGLVALALGLCFARRRISS